MSDYDEIDNNPYDLDATDGQMGCPDCRQSDEICVACERWVCGEHSVKCIDCDDMYCETCAAKISVGRWGQYKCVDENGRCEECVDRVPVVVECAA